MESWIAYRLLLNTAQVGFSARALRIGRAFSWWAIAGCLLALLLNSSPLFYASAFAFERQTDCSRFLQVKAWKGTFSFTFSGSGEATEELERRKREYLAIARSSMSGPLNLDTREADGTFAVRWSGSNDAQVRIDNTSKVIDTTTYPDEFQPHLMNSVYPSLAWKREQREYALDHEKYISDDSYTETANGNAPLLATDGRAPLRMSLGDECSYTLSAHAEIETTLEGV